MFVFGGYDGTSRLNDLVEFRFVHVKRLRTYWSLFLLIFVLIVFVVAVPYFIFLYFFFLCFLCVAFVLLYSCKPTRHTSIYIHLVLGIPHPCMTSSPYQISRHLLYDRPILGSACQQGDSVCWGERVVYVLWWCYEMYCLYGTRYLVPSGICFGKSCVLLNSSPQDLTKRSTPYANQATNSNPVGSKASQPTNGLVI